jgi:thioredoxin 1
MNLEEFNNIKQNQQLTLIYFSTQTCNVCKVLKPQIKALIDAYPPWRFVYIDGQDSSTVAAQNMVFSAPALILYVEGKEVARFGRHFGLHELEDILSRYQELLA